jgi:hypothetical protein
MLFSRRKKIMADVEFVTVDLNLAFKECKSEDPETSPVLFLVYSFTPPPTMSASFINRPMAGDKAQSSLTQEVPRRD